MPYSKASIFSVFDPIHLPWPPANEEAKEYAVQKGLPWIFYNSDADMYWGAGTGEPMGMYELHQYHVTVFWNP